MSILEIPKDYYLAMTLDFWRSYNNDWPLDIAKQYQYLYKGHLKSLTVLRFSYNDCVWFSVYYNNNIDITIAEEFGDIDNKIPKGWVGYSEYGVYLLYVVHWCIRGHILYQKKCWTNDIEKKKRLLDCEKKNTVKCIKCFIIELSQISETYLNDIPSFFVNKILMYL